MGLVLHLVVSFRAIDPCPVLSFTGVGSVLFFRFLTSFSVPVAIILIAGDTSIIVRSIRGGIGVQVLLIVVPNGSVLNVSSSRFLRVLLYRACRRLVHRSQDILEYMARQSVSRELASVQFRRPLDLGAIHGDLGTIHRRSFHDRRSHFQLARCVVSAPFRSHSLACFSGRQAAIW